MDRETARAMRAGYQVWRVKETCVARMVVHQGGGERETDEPPPFLRYTGWQVFRDS